LSALEKHYTCKEVGRLWGLSPDTVRKLFSDYPGVLKVAQPGRRFKRSYVSLRIPESTLQKRHAELRARTA